jgi:hypothetical protein
MMISLCTQYLLNHSMAAQFTLILPASKLETFVHNVLNNKRGAVQQLWAKWFGLNRGLLATLHKNDPITDGQNDCRVIWLKIHNPAAEFSEETFESPVPIKCRDRSFYAIFKKVFSQRSYIVIYVSINETHFFPLKYVCGTRVTEFYLLQIADLCPPSNC